jgi:hypothetical protein
MAIVKRSLEKNTRFEAQTQIGPEVYGYIRKQLQPWGDTLSEEIYRLPLEQGKVFAYLPLGFKLHSPGEFQYGQAWIPDDPDVGWRLNITFVLDYLKVAPDRVAIFATHWYAHDPVATKLVTPYFLMNVRQKDEKLIYCFVANSAAHYSSIEQAFSEARVYPFVAILTSLPNGLLLEHDKELLDEGARSLAIRTRCLLVGAFENIAKLI